MNPDITPDLIERLLERAIQIQRIPAPPFKEGERAAFVQQMFLSEGLLDVQMDNIGNVYARLPGSGQARPLALSAHLDTVFPAETDLVGRRDAEQVYGPGIGDNSLGVAGMFGLLWALRENQQTLPGDLWLIANVGEEGLGDLRGMRAVVSSSAARFGGQVLAYLVLEGMALGQIYHRALGVQRYRISVGTDGGHSWVDYGKPSAVHELAALAARLAGLSLPAQPRTTLNIGVMTGGSGVNVIAAQAWLELDLRCESVLGLQTLAQKVEKLCQAANKPGVAVTFEIIGSRPAGEIPADHPLVRLAQNCLRQQGIQANLTIGSTDANIPLNQGTPAITIGLTKGAGAHTKDEYINIAPLASGLAQLVAIVQGAYRAL